MAKSKKLNLTMIVSVLVILFIIGYLVYTGLNIKENKETFNDNDYPECINVKFFIIENSSNLKEWWKRERYGTKWTQEERNIDLIDDQLIYKMLRNEDGTPTRKIPSGKSDYPYTYIYEIIPAHKKYINNGRFGGMRKTYIGVGVISKVSYWYVISPNGTHWGNTATASVDYNLSQDTNPDQGIRFREGLSGPTTARILAGVCPSNTTTAMPTTTPTISNMANVMWGSTRNYPNRRWWNRKRRTLENKKINPGVPTPLAKDEKSFVQCCPSNGEPTPGHFRRGKGVRWCPSRRRGWLRRKNYPGDDESKWGADQRTYNEAKNICQNIKTPQYKKGVPRKGIRRLKRDQNSVSSYDLCTRAQIESDDATGIGCFYNWENVWIKDEE